MKICIPVTGSEGLQALIQPEFTTAEHLLVFDLQSGEHRTFSRDSEQEEGAPEEPIAVDAVLCAGMDRGIVRAFAAQGIQVFATEAESVAQALQALRDGEVEELIAGGCCGGAHHHGEEEEEHECCGGQGGCGCGGEGHDHEEDHECCGGGGGGCGCHA